MHPLLQTLPRGRPPDMKTWLILVSCMVLQSACSRRGYIHANQLPASLQVVLKDIPSYYPGHKYLNINNQIFENFDFNFGDGTDVKEIFLYSRYELSAREAQGVLEAAQELGFLETGRQYVTTDIFKQPVEVLAPPVEIPSNPLPLPSDAFLHRFYTSAEKISIHLVRHSKGSSTVDIEVTVTCHNDVNRCELAWPTLVRLIDRADYHVQNR
jgi:hypothetical protein